jgi:hypothetical protein
MGANRSIKIVAVSTLMLFVASCGAVAAVPMLRHYLIALFNDPGDLPALESDARGRPRMRSALDSY